MSAVELTFWAAAAFVAWTYAGFPMVLWVRGLRPLPEPLRGGPPPRVDLVVVVHNEAAVIEAKLANLAALDYPRDRLRVIVVSDGSDDDTNRLVGARAYPFAAELIALDRVGKNAALNEGIAASDGEIIALSDADTLLEPDALTRLVAPFRDPGIGAVAGDFRYAADCDEGRGERSYWRMDRWWKQLESRSGSTTSATGQIYAIRRTVAERVPDGVTDDFFLSTGAIEAGLRLWFEPTARARGPVAQSPDAEFRRKVRMIGRGFASVWSRRRLLDPRRTGFYAIQLLSHKVMRRLIGFPLAVLLVGATLLASVHPFYALAAIGQIVFHALALAGYALRDHRWGRTPVVALPLAFDAANLAALVAFANFACGRSDRHWVPERHGERLASGAVAPNAAEST